ncbi:MAG: Exodeoxyribonuclease 7 large subunit [Steroidobacteraceae bacterium]|nr:Exodeoxyribonuclease 7 large subunit [Steroidobacteraceae bacterium]
MPSAERNVYTVSRLNREVRLLLEQGLPGVWVEGEISNLARPGSGHWYFSLKDRDAQIRCAMFRQKNGIVKFQPKDGLAVIARGRVSLYEPRGDFQLIVEHLEEAGLGALKREFERLRDKLAAEGLFDEARKRSLPQVPRRIGIVTSPTGAAVRDILHVLERRFPPAPVLIYPTPVQGAAAVPGILAALELAAQRADCDVLIVARGGGSLEDLWAFNDERIARAIRAMPMPVVTGIGHEVDFTIADFAADLRAPTPTAAAQLAVPDGRAWLQTLVRIEQRLVAGGTRVLREAAARLEGIGRRMRLASPAVRVTQATQRMDELEQRLAFAARAALLGARHRAAELGQRLTAASPVARMHAATASSAALATRLEHAMRNELARNAHRLDLASRTLDAVSPLATLRRGFAVVTQASTGALVTDAATLAAGDTLVTRLAAGQFRSRVVED